MPDFDKKLEHLINECSMENGSDTPDFILAEYLTCCLIAFNNASRKREKWYAKDTPVGPVPASPRALQVAARVWCDHDMLTMVMDTDAALEIARIVDRVLLSQPENANKKSAKY